MSKYFAALLLSLLPASLASAQSNSISLRDGDEFRGPVRTVRTEMTRLSRQNGEDVEGPRVLVRVKTYSPDGRRGELIAYKPDGSQQYRDVYIYNDAGKLAEKDTYNETDTLTRKQVNSFDETGRLTAEIAYNGDETLQQRKLLIWSDSKDRILEIDTYDGAGTLIRRDVNHYENNKSIWLTDEPGGKRSKQTFDLNGAPRLQEYVAYDDNGSVARKTEFSKESPVQHVEGTDYNADGSVRRKTSQTRERDSYHNVTKITDLVWDKETEAFEPRVITYNTISYY